MVGWHHRLDGPEFEQAPGVGDGQGDQVCCSPWGRKELDTTWWLNSKNNNPLMLKKKKKQKTPTAPGSSSELSLVSPSGPVTPAAEPASSHGCGTHASSGLSTSITTIPSTLAGGRSQGPALILPLALFVVRSLSRVRLCDPVDCSTPGLPVLNWPC